MIGKGAVCAGGVENICLVGARPTKAWVASAGLFWREGRRNVEGVNSPVPSCQSRPARERHLTWAVANMNLCLWGSFGCIVWGRCCNTYTGDVDSPSLLPRLSDTDCHKRPQEATPDVTMRLSTLRSVPTNPTFPLECLVEWPRSIHVESPGQP